MSTQDPRRIGSVAVSRYLTQRRVAVLERAGGASSGVSATDPNALHRTLANQKGDILVATGADTFAILEGPPMDGSADGWVLTVDSSTPTGLAWTSVVTIPPMPTFNISNWATDRTFDADATSIDELADAFGTFVMLDLPSPPSYSITNDTTDRMVDTDVTSLDEAADVFATLVADVIAGGGPGGWSISNVTERRMYDANSVSLDIFLDVMGTLVDDLITASLLTA